MSHLSTFSRWMLGAFAALVILYFGVAYWAEGQVAAKLADIAPLQYEALDLSLWRGDLSLSGIQYVSKTGNEEKEDTLFVKRASINDLSYFSMWNSETVQLGGLILEGVSGTYGLAPKKEVEEVDEETSSKRWSAVRIKNIELRGNNLRVKKEGGWEMGLGNTEILLNDYEYGPSRPLCPEGWNAIQAKVEGYHFLAKDAVYAYECAALELSGPDGELQIGEFAMRPQFSKTNWSAQFAHKKSRMALTVDRILASSFTLAEIINKQEIRLGGLTLLQAQLGVYSDEKKQPCTDCYKALLHEKLAQLAIPIHIPLIEIKESQININTWSTSAEKKVELSFDRLYASIYEVSNLKDSTAKQAIVIDAQADLFEGAPLNVRFELDAQAPDYPYRFSGGLGPVDLVRLNEILGSASRIAIAEGQMDKLSFSVEGNNTLASGEIELRYAQLEVELQNDEQESRKFLSKIVNKMLISKGSDGLEKGKIHYPRNPNHGFFHQCWHALQTGLSSVILPDVLLRKELR